MMPLTQVNNSIFNLVILFCWFLIKSGSLLPIEGLDNLQPFCFIV
ncbi:hypothetical protein SM39_2672 [Serratia marcescens SM39]|uniref:Uncharacterized protein n=1 Tax=Serratia marcescens SM39 TaxID=1334564 RepID=A0AAT9E6S2_SERMA|nr:hypothetical protein SM39_2672 [Serratia marcescens SM39]